MENLPNPLELLFGINPLECLIIGGILAFVLICALVVFVANFMADKNIDDLLRKINREDC